MGLLRRVLRWIAFGRKKGWRARFRRWTGGRQPTPGGADPGLAPSPASSASVRPEGSGWVAVIPSDELKEGEVLEVRVEGEPVALARSEGKCWAVSGVCPHAGAPLGEGSVEGRRLICSLHGFVFQLEDGSCEVDPALRVRVLPVRERAGQVEVGLG